MQVARGGVAKGGGRRDCWLIAIDAQLEKEHMRRALNLKDLEAATSVGNPRLRKRSKEQSSLRGIWTEWKRHTNTVYGTCNCFTSEMICYRVWATRTQPPLIYVV